MSTRVSVPIVAGLLVAGLLGLPPAGAAASPAAATAAPSADRSAARLTTAQFESRLLALANARRKKVGCKALVRNTALTRAARQHTARMVRTGSFSHQVAGEAALGKRATNAGYTRWRALGETIAWGAGVTPAGVFDMWMHSAPHKAIIQTCRYKHAGFGVRYTGTRVWVTGDYGKR